MIDANTPVPVKVNHTITASHMSYMYVKGVGRILFVRTVKMINTNDAVACLGSDSRKDGPLSIAELGCTHFVTMS